MDQYQIMSIITRLNASSLDPETVPMMFAKLIADVADRLTVEEMRRFLAIGTYINNRPGDIDIESLGENWRGNQRLN